MATTGGSPRVIRFGVFEVDVRSGELRKKGLKIRLQEQPLQVLSLLLGQPGELVTREDLKQNLWPADTFVDFDHSLNTAINKLREALGDSASSPRFVETLPRRGYRFIYPVAKARGERRLASAITSLAVLPLANLSGDPDQDYFVDGMTDALITELAQIGTLRVISRTSVMRYKDTKKRVTGIARELNVGAVVEGTVTRIGDRVRISAQLIEAATDRHLWARSYERDVRDVLALQGDLARAIAREVRGQLSPRGHEGANAKRPIDPEAYDLGLKARFLTFQWGTGENIKRAIQYYEQAIERDPAYATAHAGLAQAYVHLASALVENVSPLQIIPKARVAARKALELDETEVDAYVALGWITAFNDWDWLTAECAFGRAVELNPSHASAHMFLAHLSNTVGRHEEAVTLMRRARELDPLSAHILWSLPQGHMHVGAFEQAAEECKKGSELYPDFWPLHTLLGHVFLWQGSDTRARSSLEKGVELSQRHPHALAVLGAAHGCFGRRGEALEVLAELRELSQRRYFCPAEMAWVYATLGEADLALDALEKAYDERSPWMTRLRLLGPLLGTLPSEPRFQDLVRRMRFPQ